MLHAEGASRDKDQRILEAAKEVFVKKGIDGTVMQDIADEAGISRTALHYYFRSKKKLFEAVFDDLFDHFLPRVEEIMSGEMPFQEKIKWFVDHYLDLFKENPYLPNFIMNELNKNPDKIVAQFAMKGLLSDRMRQWMEKEMRDLDSEIPASQFVANLISLCVFPFIAKPLFNEFFIDDKPGAFDRFIDERKGVIVETLMGSINNASPP